MQETGFIHFPLKVSNYLKAYSASFSRAQNVSSWFLPWIPFRVYCRSVTAVANEILVELGGGQHSLFYNPLPFGLNFDQGLGGISWSICLTALGMLIPSSVKDFIDRLLNVLLLDLALLTIVKSLWTICLSSLLWSRKCLLLLLLISRVTLLQSLILYILVNCFKSSNHH